MLQHYHRQAELPIAEKIVTQTKIARRPGDFSCVALSVGGTPRDPKTMTEEEFLNAIETLPENEHDVNFCVNHILREKPVLLSDVFQKLKFRPKVTKITLNYLFLYKMSVEELVALSLIADTVKTVNLKGNGLGKLEPADFQKIIKTLSVVPDRSIKGITA